MPLARAALYAQGIDVYLAPTWDNSDVWVPTLRHIAKEGRVYVIGDQLLPARQRRPGRPAGTGRHLRRRGRLAVAGQHHDRRSRRRRSWPARSTEEEGILYAELDVAGPGRPAGSSTRSATTPVPTSSASRSTPGPARRSGSPPDKYLKRRNAGQSGRYQQRRRKTDRHLPM